MDFIEVLKTIYVPFYLIFIYFIVSGSLVAQ